MRDSMWVWWTQSQISEEKVSTLLERYRVGCEGGDAPRCIMRLNRRSSNSLQLMDVDPLRSMIYKVIKLDPIRKTCVRLGGNWDRVPRIARLTTRGVHR